MNATMERKLVRGNGGQVINARVLFRDNVSGTSVSVGNGTIYQDGRPMNAEDVAYWAARYFEMRADCWLAGETQQIVSTQNGD